MSEKLVLLRASREILAEPHPDIATFVDQALALVHDDVIPTDKKTATDEFQHLTQLKGVVKVLGEAINELLERRNQQLYSLMIEAEEDRFARNGRTYYLTHDKFVKVIGGADSTDFKQWLKDNKLEAIIKPTIHAQTLRSTVLKYLEKFDEDYTTEVVAQLMAEHPAQEQRLEYENRKAQVERLRKLTEITEVPKVGAKAS